MLRKTLILGVASLLVVSAAFAGAGAGQSLGSEPDITQASGGADDLPEWHVTVEDGEVSALEAWTEESDQRTLLRSDNASNTATVRVPADQAGTGWLDRQLGTGLAGLSYVESVQPVWIHERTEPVSLVNASEVERPELSTYRSLRNRDAEYTTEGIAFAEDASEARLEDVRAVTGQDSITGTGSGMTIAVIDTGINTANGRVFGNGTSGSSSRILPESKDIIENETVAADGMDAIEDGNGHGTHVASTAAADPTGTTNDGMAPDASILGIRALNDDGQGQTDDIAAGVRYAADNGADVIVMSLGSPVHDEAIEKAITYAVEEQDVSAVVTAAGNSRQTTRWVSAPASHPGDNTIAVAASNTSSNDTAQVAYFSNLGDHPGTTDNSDLETQGQEIDVAAPGMKLTARTPTSSGTVINTTLSGTSMAAPVVAGGTAAVLDERPGLVGNHTGVRAELRDSARPMPSAAESEAGQGLYASDAFASGTDSGSQTEAMTTEASARNEFWSALSDGSGGFVARLLGGIAS